MKKVQTRETSELSYQICSTHFGRMKESFTSVESGSYFNNKCRHEVPFLFTSVAYIHVPYFYISIVASIPNSVSFASHVMTKFKQYRNTVE